MDEATEFPALQRLLLAHAPAAQRDWHRLAWLLDQRLASVVRGASEPMIALIRMAWWDEALVDDDRSKGKGEPLVDAWRASSRSRVAGPHAARLIEGWRVLIESDDPQLGDLIRYAAARGGGLFGLLTEGTRSSLRTDDEPGWGAVWALWDLAAHLSDPAFAQRVMDVAQDIAASLPPLLRDAARPLRLAIAVALPDVRAGQVPTPFSPRHYLRLLRGLLLA